MAIGLPNIDLELLRAEQAGLAAPPKNRHATEQARNDSAAQHKLQTNNEYPENVASVEQHMLAKGYTVGAVNEHMRNLAKHQEEKPATPPTGAMVYYACGVFWPVEGRDWEEEYLQFLDGAGL